MEQAGRVIGGVNAGHLIFYLGKVAMRANVNVTTVREFLSNVKERGENSYG